MEPAALHCCVGTLTKPGQSPPTLKLGKFVTYYIAKTPLSQFKSTCKARLIIRFFYKATHVSKSLALAILKPRSSPFHLLPLWSHHCTFPGVTLAKMTRMWPLPSRAR